MVKVYFETPNHSHTELTAVFDSEETYNALRATLSGLAREQGYVITESITDENLNDLKEQVTQLAAVKPAPALKDIAQRIRDLRDDDTHVCTTIDSSSEKCSCSNYDETIDMLEKVETNLQARIDSAEKIVELSRQWMTDEVGEVSQWSDVEEMIEEHNQKFNPEN